MRFTPRDHPDSRAKKLNELQRLLDTVQAELDALVASAIPITPAGNIASTNVQSAIYELDTEKATTGALADGLALKANLAGGNTFTGIQSADARIISTGGDLSTGNGTAAVASVFWRGGNTWDAQLNAAGEILSFRRNGVAVMDLNNVTTSITGNLTVGGNATLSGIAFPYLRYTPSGWAGQSFYLEAGLNSSSGSSGDYVNFNTGRTGGKFGWIISGFGQRMELNSLGLSVAGTGDFTGRTQHHAGLTSRSGSGIQLNNAANSIAGTINFDGVSFNLGIASVANFADDAAAAAGGVAIGGVYRNGSILRIRVS